jgi:hypothetical protein
MIFAPEQFSAGFSLYDVRSLGINYERKIFMAANSKIILNAIDIAPTNNVESISATALMAFLSIN